MKGSGQREKRKEKKKKVERKKERKKEVRALFQRAHPFSEGWALFERVVLRLIASAAYFLSTVLAPRYPFLRERCWLASRRMMIVVAQKGESHPAAAVSSKLFSGMLDGRRTEYRHDNQPTDHVCIDPRGGVRACVRAGHRKRIESERERERKGNANRETRREWRTRADGERKRLNEERVNLDVEHHSDDWRVL